MKKTYFIIAGLIALLAWREYYHAHAYAAPDRCAEQVASAIQDTSDALLDACEAKIDEVESNYRDLIDHIEDNCADMIEDAVEETKQEILAQF